MDCKKDSIPEPLPLLCTSKNIKKCRNWNWNCNNCIPFQFSANTNFPTAWGFWLEISQKKMLHYQWKYGAGLRKQRLQRQRGDGDKGEFQLLIPPAWLLPSFSLSWFYPAVSFTTRILILDFIARLFLPLYFNSLISHLALDGLTLKPTLQFLVHHYPDP